MTRMMNGSSSVAEREEVTGVEFWCVHGSHHRVELPSGRFGLEKSGSAGCRKGKVG